MNRILIVAGWSLMVSGVLPSAVGADETVGIPEAARLGKPSTIQVQTLAEVRIRKIGKLNDGKAARIAVTLERWAGPGDWEPARTDTRIGEVVRTEAYSKKLKAKVAFETPWIFERLATREIPRSHTEQRPLWKNGAQVGVEEIVVQDTPSLCTEAVLRDPGTGAVLRVRLGEELP